MTTNGFDIIEFYADGAFGSVCAARDLSKPDSPTVALKILKSDVVQHPDAVKRARDEARMLQQLNHPNIIKVEQLLQVKGRPVVVMEWVEGVSIQEIIDAFPEGVSGRLALSIIAQTAAALHTAYHSPTRDGHPMHLIHRDIKPSNILVSTTGIVKLVDFGQAKGDFAGREALSSTFVLGSHGYNAPERMEGVVDEPAIDVYALGLTLFELCSGRKAIISMRRDKHNLAVVKHAENLNVVKLSSADNREIRALFMKMCDYKPSVRPTMAMVQKQLGAMLCDLTVTMSEEQLAAEIVTPIFQARKPRLPTARPQDEKLRDLLRHIDDHIEATSSTSASANHHNRVDELIKHLASPNWENNIDILDSLLESSTTDVNPLVKVITQFQRPWWRFWAPKSSPEQAQVALQLLMKHAPPHVVKHAKKALNQK